MKPAVLRWTSKEVDLLRSRFTELAEETAFSDEPLLASKVAAYGIFREIGTINDELARFIFDADTGTPVLRESLKAEFVEWRGLFGVRIHSTQSTRLELRTKGFYEVVHPGLSKNEDGTLHSLYIFPEIIREIAKGEGVELVLVKTWGMNSIFGGFDPAKEYYQTNFWEIENNDALKFADLIRRRRLALMGTHDLIAHVAGLDHLHWPLLVENANRVYESINAYFKTTTKPSVSALILPYLMGVVLDDLAQPPSDSSKSHLAVLEELITVLAKRDVPANLPTLLKEFPRSFQDLVELSRNTAASKSEIKEKVKNLVQEILAASFVCPA